MLQKFIEKRKQIGELIEANVLNNPEISEETKVESGIFKSMDNMNDEAFRVALIAPFSAGKSTFVNGLIGQDLLSRNILAETAAITTLKYAKNRKIVVHYYDGSIEQFPKHEDEFVTDDELKEYLKERTTVSREGQTYAVRVEDSVRAVEVHWDIDLLKNGVELIDTPGLFSRHKEHSDITEKILPNANAILFLIEPTSVGEAHFTELISSYVENAKRSNLNTEGKHIFFIINKVDRYRPDEIKDARRELEVVLKTILKEPQILEISSYFAMKARMFEQGKINLMDLQTDRDILFVDDNGYPVTGPFLTEEKVPKIKEISKINEIEDTLGDYFEYKNNYLIEEVMYTAFTIFSLESDSLSQRIQMLQNNFEKDETFYAERLDKLQNDFEQNFQSLTNYTRDKIDDDLDHVHVLNGISDIRKGQIEMLANNVQSKVRQTWKNRKKDLNKNSAERVMVDIIQSLELNIQTAKKSLVQSIFTSMEKKFNGLTNDFVETFEKFEQELELSIVRQLDLKPIEQKRSFFNKDQILNKVRKEIEELFIQTTVEFSSQIKHEIQNEIKKNTSSHRVPGFWNGIKSIFGKEEREESFNGYQFERAFKDLMDDVIDDAIEELKIEASGVELEIANKILDINDSFSDGITAMLNHFRQWRTRNMELLRQELAVKKEDTEEEIGNLENRIISLEARQKQLKVDYETILEGEEADEPHTILL